MTTIGQAIIEVRGDVSGFESDIRSGTSSSKMSKLGSIAGKGLAIGFTAAAGAVIGGGAFLKGAISSASDLSETVNKSNTIFGKNADAIMSWSKTSATAFGLSQQEALAAAAGLGDFFSQIGFAGKASASMSKSTVQMAADLGSFNNLETGDVLDRISAAMRGEFDSLQAVIPNINAARVENAALAATGKKTAAELTAQEKATATLAIITKDGARAQGDFAKTSGGLANQQKIAGAQFDNLKAKIGTGLLPVATKLFSFLNTTAIPAMVKLGPSFTAAANMIGPVISSISGFISKLSGSGAGGVGGLGARIETLKTTFMSVFANVKTIVVDAVAIIQSLWARFGGIITSTARRSFNNLAQIIRGAFNVIAGIFKVVSSLLKGDWKGVWEGIKQILRGAWNVIKGIVKQGFNVLSSLFRGIAATLRGLWSGLWNGLKSAASSAWNGIKNVVKNGATAVVTLVKGIPGKIAEVGGKFLEAGKDIMGKIFDGIRAGAGGVGDFISSIASAIKSAINGALGLPFTINGPGPLPDFTIPAFARGGRLGKGLALVGEEGPEIIASRGGGRVYDAQESARIARRNSQAGAAGGGGGSLRVVSGTLSLDERGRAFFRGLAVEEIDAAGEFAGTLARMR